MVGDVACSPCQGEGRRFEPGVPLQLKGPGCRRLIVGAGPFDFGPPSRLAHIGHTAQPAARRQRLLGQPLAAVRAARAGPCAAGAWHGRGQVCYAW